MITSYMMIAENETLGILMTVIIISLLLYSRNKRKRREKLQTGIKSLREWP